MKASWPVGSAAEADAASSVTRGAGASRTTRLLLGLALVSSALLVAAFAEQLRRPTTGPRPALPAPHFSFQTFEGEKVDLADLRGRVVVLNFWASWCVSCVYEAQDLEAVWRDYGPRGVTVLGVAFNDTRPGAVRYLERHGITYPNGMDPGGVIAAAYRLKGVPETVLVDAQGRIVPLQVAGASGTVAKIVGPITAATAFTPDDLRATLERLLAEGGT